MLKRVSPTVNTALPCNRATKSLQENLKDSQDLGSTNRIIGILPATRIRETLGNPSNQRMLSGAQSPKPSVKARYNRTLYLRSSFFFTKWTEIDFYTGFHHSSRGPIFPNFLEFIAMVFYTVATSTAPPRSWTIPLTLRVH